MEGQAPYSLRLSISGIADDSRMICNLHRGQLRNPKARSFPSSLLFYPAKFRQLVDRQGIRPFFFKAFPFFRAPLAMANPRVPVLFIKGFSTYRHRGEPVSKLGCL
jgi:hypothetical protein